MAPANRVRQNIRNLLNDLQNLAGQSDLAQTALKNLNAVIAEIASNRFTASYDKLAQSIDRLMQNLSVAGATAESVRRLRDELYKLAAQEARTPEVVGARRAGGAGYRGIVKQQQQERAEAAQRVLLREQGVNRVLQEQIRNRQRLAQLVERGITRRGALGIRVEQHRFAQMIEEERRIAETGVRPSTATAGEGGRSFAELARSGFIPGGEVGIRNVEQELNRLGLTAGRVLRPIADVNSGIRTFTIETTDLEGNLSRARVRVDQFGRVLVDSSKRFRSFGSAIVRDTAEVLKWTIAIGLVYTPIRLLNRIVEDSIRLQAELAESQIVLADTTRTVADVFQAASEVADLTGTTIEGVIESYNEAFAATSSFADESQRASVTQQLLQDSMTLSILAGINQTEAMDTLVGALRQANLELDEGSILLDQWVAVAKNANVSINTLASSFAIVGDAAAGAGIDTQELVAISATLAEVTKLSADETGNAIRGFISGFQQAKSEQTLSALGISIRDVNGDLRDFTDIIEEIIRLREAGFLGEEDVTQIANVVGGGFRRGAQLTALIENYGRTLELIDVAQGASGDSAEALATRLDTVQTAVTRLGNAFTELTQAVGTEGGFLAEAEFAINLLTQLTKVITNLTKSVGAATTPLVLFGFALGALQTRQGQQLLNRGAPALLSNLAAPGGRIGARLSAYAGQGGYYQGTKGIAPYPQFIPGTSGALTIGEAFAGVNARFRNFAGRIPGVGRGIAGAGLLGAGVTAGLSGTSLVEGLLAEGVQARRDAFVKAGAQLVGGFIGGLTGSPVGAIIGSAAGGAFVQRVTEDVGRITDEIARLRGLAEEGGAGDGITTRPQLIRERIAELEQQLADSTTLVQEIQANTISIVAGILGMGEFTAGTARLGALQAGAGQIQGRGILEQAILGTGFIGRAGGATDEQVQAYREILRLQEELQTIEAPQLGTDAYARAIADNKEDLNDIAKEMGNAFVQETLLNFQRGKAPLGKYQEAQALAPTLAEQGAVLQTAFNFAGVTEDAQEFLDVLVRISDDERINLVGLANGIIAAQRALDGAPESTKEEELAMIDLANATREFLQVYDATAIQVQANQLELLPTIDLGDVTRAQAREIVQAAEGAQEDYYRALFGDSIPEDVLQELKDRGQESILAIGEGAERTYLDTTRIASQFFSQVQDSFADQQQQFQFRDLRNQVSQQQLPQLLQRYRQVVTAFEQQFGDLGFEEEPEDVGLILTDGFDSVNVNLTLLNLAMQDLIELNEDQLEGIFNIPEGLTAFIPATGRTYFSDQPFPRGGGIAGAGFAPFDQVAVQEAIDTAVTEASTAAYEARRSIVEEGRRGGEGIQAYEARREGLVGRAAPYKFNRDEIRAFGESLRKSYITESKILSPKAAREEAGYQNALSVVGRAGADIGTQLGSALAPSVQSFFESVVASLPSSIPVTTNVDFEATIPVIIDGAQILQAIQKRLFSELKTAKKRTGTVGYIVE